jgi:hypothetical protein
MDDNQRAELARQESARQDAKLQMEAVLRNQEQVKLQMENVIRRHERYCPSCSGPTTTGGECVNCMKIRELNERTSTVYPVGAFGKAFAPYESTNTVQQQTDDPITYSESLSPMERGNAFNRARAFDYPYREVYIRSPIVDGAYVRLDAYKPGEEIVSRKFTQLAEHPEDAIKHIYELVNKYPQGAFIAGVPSSEGLEKTGELSGLMLEGQHILEIPHQANPVPPEVLDVARANGVVIREDTSPRYLPEV